ncbi:hypothetical protein D082_17140 [Synechocystis sp. PCC 6714]|nr:hypothetical protein D082_17140 [Synechocystis sp. PCC 6714]
MSNYFEDDGRQNSLPSYQNQVGTTSHWVLPTALNPFKLR